MTISPAALAQPRTTHLGSWPETLQTLGPRPARCFGVLARGPQRAQQTNGAEEPAQGGEGPREQARKPRDQQGQAQQRRADGGADRAIVLLKRIAAGSLEGRANARHRYPGTVAAGRPMPARLALGPALWSLRARARAPRAAQPDLAGVRQIVFVHRLHLGAEL